MSTSTSQLYLCVCNELGDFISQTKAFSYRVRVTFTSKKKHYGSKVRIYIYKCLPNVQHNKYWSFVTGHVWKVCGPVSFSVRDRTRSSSFTHNSGFTGFQSLLGFNLLFNCYINNLHSLQDCFFCFWDTCNYLISL